MYILIFLVKKRQKRANVITNPRPLRRYFLLRTKLDSDIPEIKSVRFLAHKMFSNNLEWLWMNYCA
jgi:hypothetical protein